MSARIAKLAGIGAIALVAMAHVGSPDVYFTGKAGPYAVMVVVRPPGVIPGRAQVFVQVREPVQRVTVQPVFWETSTGGAPAPDVAAPVPGASDTYGAQLWLMTGGSYSVAVQVEGARGTGKVNVPVPSVATRELPMERTRGLILLGLGTFLVVGLLSIVGSAAREATLEPGAQVDGTHRRGARIATAAGGAVVLIALLGGAAWWGSEARNYRRIIYKPLRATTSVTRAHGTRTLHLAIADTAWRRGRRRGTPLVPDHGKLMHLFLVRAPDMDAFAHLHPVTSDSTNFRVALPALPPGTYRVYADIIHASGFPETITDSVVLGAIDSAETGAPSADPGDSAAWTDRDDAWTVSAGAPRTSRLADGSTMTWERGDHALTAGTIAPLTFTVTAPDGRPAVLQPYMGMAGHAMIARADGRVFVHLHPMGTIAAVAQELFDRRERGDTAMAGEGMSMPMPMAPATLPDTVSFPYAFPAPGRYRIWVQVERQGTVLTGTFDVEVR
ncbi:MAG: hypothetical protein IRY91_06150 [Gemmatimonadaceae bacterium]|nr:hypothetical protein [Gemmatimonadaceae bacterium]